MLGYNIQYNMKFIITFLVTMILLVITYILLCEDDIEGFYAWRYLPYGYSYNPFYYGYGYRFPYFSHSGFGYGRPIYQEYDDGRNAVNVNVTTGGSPWYNYMNPYYWW